MIIFIDVSFQKVKKKKLKRLYIDLSVINFQVIKKSMN